MDYKNLIEQLRNVFQKDGYELEQSVCESAASAIETLLMERDAAVKYIPKVCYTCKHWNAGGCNAPITGGKCEFNLRQAWQWRGPQKGESHDL